MKEENINCTIEALILASPEPVSLRKICDVLEGITPGRVREAIDDLNNVYMGCGTSFRIREVAGGYQFYILPDFEQPIKTMLTKQRTMRLTQAALETLAIIAYKQPVTKTDIEHIRGVATDGVLHNLLQHKLIAIAGRNDAPGRPLLYKTSDEFLKFFGLNRLSDLPRMEEIEEMIRQAEGPREQTQMQFGDAQGRVEEREGEEDDIEYFAETRETDDQSASEPDGSSGEEDDELSGIGEDSGEALQPTSPDDSEDTEETPSGDNGMPDLKEMAARWLAEYEPLPDDVPLPVTIRVNLTSKNDNGDRDSIDESQESKLTDSENEPEYLAKEENPSSNN